MPSFKDAIKGSNRGVLLRLHVTPGASQSIFPEKYDQWRKTIEIKVRSAAKDDKANSEVIDMIVEFFQLSPNDVILIKGEKSREKTLYLKNISVDMVKTKLRVRFHG